LPLSRATARALTALAAAALAVVALAVAPAAHAADRQATPATLASVVGAAKPGDRVLLAAGDYGTFAGAAKPGRVTLQANPGALASIALDFSAAANLTLDGLTVKSASLTGTTHDITVQNSRFTGFTSIDGLKNANVLFDRDSFNGIDSCDSGCNPARIWLGYSSDAPSGFTLSNSQLIGGSSDGVQAGPPVKILDNEFSNITEGDCAACHTDAIQLYCGCTATAGSTIAGNYIHDSATAIGGYDGNGHHLIEDNVLWRNGVNTFVLGGDNGSIIRHNTTDGAIDLTSKAGQSSHGTVVQDNIAKTIILANGVGGTAKPAANSGNMLRSGAGGANFAGRPTFAGRGGGLLASVLGSAFGLAPTVTSGFRLARTSRGHGTGVGARIAAPRVWGA
jgi:Right handed beta helix region